MYKRLVIYLYCYKNGEKKENCGYAKVNIQNRECKIEINIRHAAQLEGEQTIYLLKKEGKLWRKKQITDTKAEKGTINLKYTCKYSDIMEETPDDEIEGILIYDGNNMMKAVCGTQEEKEISLLEIAEEETLKTAEMIRTDTEKYNEKNRILSEESENSIYEYDEECLKKKAENHSADCMEEVKIESCSMSLNDEENSQRITTDIWQEKMFRVFPKVMININGKQTTGIRLKPHDIVWFPGSYWRLASNKFLLNGYYNYRYILFFKGSGEHEGRYFLGTPGYFGVSDAITAKKFGFTDFFMTGDLDESKGASAGSEGRNFGFWCRET